MDKYSKRNQTQNKRLKMRSATSSRVQGSCVTARLSLLPLSLLALLLLEQVAATSHGSERVEEITDPGTGFTVCRQSTLSEYGHQVGQCLGRCPEGEHTSFWRRDGSRILPKHWMNPRAPGEDSNGSGNLIQLGYDCTSNNTFSCVRSASNKCNWIGVKDYHKYSVPGGPSGLELGCYGPKPGICTWFSDPFCEKIVPPGLPPVLGGGIDCSENMTAWDRKSWCSEAYAYLVDRIKPKGCPDVTQTQVLGPPYLGEFQCIRSCQDNGDYIKVRRLGAEKVQCAAAETIWGGMDEERKCSWCT